jgi:hypothetical protein
LTTTRAFTFVAAINFAKHAFRNKYLALKFAEPVVKGSWLYSAYWSTFVALSTRSVLGHYGPPVWSEQLV